MPLKIEYHDIVNMTTDAIVNAANSDLTAGSGVCGAIFQAAGEQELQRACSKIGKCPVGQAVITPGFQLKSRYIIHAVGPIWSGGENGEEKLLANCYKNSLELAKKYSLTSLAFPLISAGIYGYPKEEALRVASNAIHNFLLQENEDMEITLVLFDKEDFQPKNRTLDQVHEYIEHYYSGATDAVEDNLKAKSIDLESDRYYSPNILSDSLVESSMLATDSVDVFLNQAAESFSECLLRIIDEKDLKDSTVYHKANVSRQIFSNIRNAKNYQPKKETAVSFCIALELNIEDSLDLLGKAGFTLSKSKKFDLIIRFFIENQQYDIMLLNETLFYFDQKLLGV